ncbi:unnamed protein product [Hymenolepis diminuta]|uniref:Cadherin domain-containing protein n=2 Tax=Hymenolepis diminuta TaxID=6216 RepID=A0A0R3SE22_HYMDI|nr:unnamed protein product [Hymenolepis diminuta]
MRHDCLRYFPILCILFLPCLLQRVSSSLPSSTKSFNGYDFNDIVPFSFPLLLYTASILPDAGPNYYILTNEPRFGVPEPFDGQPSGTVSFLILGNLEYRDAFSTETLKLGGFYFLRLRTTHNAEFNAKKQSVYSFDIQAVFQSEQIGNRPPITLTNKTRIIIRLIDRNDNCPFFSQDVFQLTAFENATLFTKIGTVHATDADRGINGQIYYFLQPERIMVPFRIDSRSGDIFPTKSLAIKRGGSTSIERITYFSKFEGLADYSFKVIARHRGNLSHVSCDLVSHAQVHVKVKPIRSDGPQISTSLYTDVEKPGSAGTVYATISVVSFGNPLNTHLSIVEPEAVALFELVRMDQQSKWQLQLKFQDPALSLSSKVGLTLEAVDAEIVTVGQIPSTSRQFLEVSLLPQPTFQIRLPQEVNIWVSEVALVNSTVHIINPNLSFYIYNSSFLFSEARKNDNVPFRITETGAVVVTEPIDLETLGTDRLEIAFTVVDRNNILLSSMADSKLVINILDYNEHGPEISNDGAERSIPENLPVGSEVLQIEARDPDFSATRLIFTLFDEDKLPFNFSITKPGSMLLKTPLDAETMPTEFHVKVKVADSGLPFPRSVIVIYIIKIIDVNEFSPVFVEKSCEAQLAVTPHGQIKTLAPSGLELGRFFAEDLDRDGSSAVKIKLASTTVSRPCFKLDPDTGRLLLICSNIGLPETSVIVHLEATDGELNSQKPFELKISLEKAGYGRVYSKSCQPSKIYEKIQEQKQKRSDYEYRLADITRIDTFFKRNDEVITPTLNIPTALRLPENLPIGTPVLTFSAKFLESFKGDQIPQLIYGVSGLQTFLASNESVSPPYQAFRLRGDSTSDVSVDDEMILEVAAPIDRETFSAFLISLRVCVLQDSARPCASSSVSIFIEDLLDAPPRFIIDDSQAGTHTFSVSEDEAEGSIIGQVVAVDDDIESKLRFSLGNYKEHFKIHHRTGRISLKQRLDRELLDSYLVSVKVVDILDPPMLNSPPDLNALALKSTPDWALERTATTYVRVNVLDANDNNPEFIGTYNDIVIPSDLPKGAYVTTLRARDADDNHNALLQYSLFGSDADKACFDCDLATGVVRIAAECEVLQPGCTHSLTAWVRDLGSPEPRQTSTEFKVTVIGLRVNAYPPRINNPNGLYHGRLKEGAPIGSRVLESGSEDPLRLRASDPEGLLLIFRTVGGSGLGTFAVTSDGKFIFYATAYRMYRKTNDSL